MTLEEFLAQGDGVSGLYYGEDPALFPVFLDSITKKLRDVDSPRNQIINMIAEDRDLAKVVRKYHPGWKWENNLLQLSSLLHHTGYTLFREYYRVLSRIENLSKNIRDLSNDTDARAKVIKDLLKKPESKPPLQNIEELIERKQEHLKNAREQCALMESDPVLQHFLDFRNRVETYQDMWNKCNIEIGTINVMKGSKLEECHPYVVQELQKKGYQVIGTWSNVNWLPKGLGEIDCLVQTTTGWVIIEFKARLHDIMFAYYQNGPNRDPRKQQVMINGSIVQLGLDTPTFVATVIPKCFVLPVASDLKRIISYSAKHPELSVDEVYAYARTIIPADRPSPYQWYINGNAAQVIVIPTEI
jgi:hypothetical protein